MKVGEHDYFQVDEDFSPASCINSCVYERFKEPGSRYCFKAGIETATCVGK